MGRRIKDFVCAHVCIDTHIHIYMLYLLRRHFGFSFPLFFEFFFSSGCPSIFFHPNFSQTALAGAVVSELISDWTLA